MQSSRKTTGSSSTYTEKSQKTLWGGFAGSLIVTMMGAIGRDFCADPDDQEPNLSLPERAACIAGGCAGMLTTSSMALAAPIVTIPLDIGTSLFRNTNTFFHKKSGRNASKPDNKIFESHRDRLLQQSTLQLPLFPIIQSQLPLHLVFYILLLMQIVLSL